MSLQNFKTRFFIIAILISLCSITGSSVKQYSQIDNDDIFLKLSESSFNVNKYASGGKISFFPSFYSFIIPSNIISLSNSNQVSFSYSWYTLLTFTSTNSSYNQAINDTVNTDTMRIYSNQFNDKVVSFTFNSSNIKIRIRHAVIGFSIATIDIPVSPILNYGFYGDFFYIDLANMNHYKFTLTESTINVKSTMTLVNYYSQSGFITTGNSYCYSLRNRLYSYSCDTTVVEINDSSIYSNVVSYKNEFFEISLKLISLVAYTTRDNKLNVALVNNQVVQITQLINDNIITSDTFVYSIKISYPWAIISIGNPSKLFCVSLNISTTNSFIYLRSIIDLKDNLVLDDMYILNNYYTASEIYFLFSSFTNGIAKTIGNLVKLNISDSNCPFFTDTDLQGNVVCTFLCLRTSRINLFSTECNNSPTADYFLETNSYMIICPSEYEPISRYVCLFRPTSNNMIVSPFSNEFQNCNSSSYFSLLTEQCTSTRNNNRLYFSYLLCSGSNIILKGSGKNHSCVSSCPFNRALFIKNGVMYCDICNNGNLLYYHYRTCDSNCGLDFNANTTTKECNNCPSQTFVNNTCSNGNCTYSCVSSCPLTSLIFKNKRDGLYCYPSTNITLITPECKNELSDSMCDLDYYNYSKLWVLW